MQQWVGPINGFYPHAAQHDFEAWLLPYWDDIQRLAHHNRTAPSGVPELVNHNKPPSHHIKEIFRTGGRHDYVKPRDAARILRGKEPVDRGSGMPRTQSFSQHDLDALRWRSVSVKAEAITLIRHAVRAIFEIRQEIPAQLLEGRRFEASLAVIMTKLDNLPRYAGFSRIEVEA
jgi:Domain of unknown function (DUF4276)